MPSFLYFVANREAGLSDADLQSLGLAYAFDGPIMQQRVLANGGPHAAAGMLLADAERCSPGRLRHVADDQQWAQAAGYCIGRWLDEEIGPTDLFRSKPRDGHFVELADGCNWLCPLARLHRAESGGVRWYEALPVGVVLGADRKWQPGGVVPRYRRLWEICQAWWDVRAASAATQVEVGQTVRFDFDRLHAAACECLAVNYRLGPDEVSLLGLFDSDAARKVLDALIDLPGLAQLSAELEKKTEPRAADG